MTEPIVRRPPSYVLSAPFESDLLHRKQLADRLTGYVERSSDGCVIGITAPWGDGKTWFGRNWCADLNQRGHKTLFLDVFESDFSEDAFTAISAEILRGVSQDDTGGKKLWQATTKLGAAILPGATKIAMAATAKLATGLTTEEIRELLEETEESGAAAAAEKYVEKRLKEHESNLKSVEHFRSELQRYCKEQSKPVVFIVDELDRCRPTYAVKIVEQIKHFFDVQNLVFVLLLNRDQLEKAIRGVYGEQVDAVNYLSKFVHFFLTLPNAQATNINWGNYLKEYCWGQADLAHA